MMICHQRRLTFLSLICILSSSAAVQLTEQGAVEECGSSGDSSGAVLLQQVHHASKTAKTGTEEQERCILPPFHYGLSSAPSDWNFRVSCEDGDCGLIMPNVSIEEVGEFWTFGHWVKNGTTAVRSRFLFGRRPHIAQRGVQVPVPGYNPTIIALPASLRAAFPQGHWLVAARESSECYSQSSVVQEDPRFQMVWNGTLLTVFTENFAALASDCLHFYDHDVPGKDDMHVLSDVRLLELSSGDVIVSFSPYAWGYDPVIGLEQDWHGDSAQLVARLHLSSRLSPQSSVPGLAAHIQRNETRVFAECPEKGLNAPGTKKNFGLFAAQSGDVYAVDWIHPTQIGLVRIDEMAASKMNPSEHITKLCFGVIEDASSESEDSSNLPWSQSWGFSCSGKYHAELHNNIHPIWIPEAGEYLGIGHMFRSCYHTRSTLECNSDLQKEDMYPRYGHHYTHFFYTLSGTHPFGLSRIGNAEFCMASSTDPSDCDLVQFIAGMTRDGEDLVFSYGVHDVWGYVSRIKVKEVLQSLVAPHEDF
mmetsp:Transcript_49989/g.89745  ORF Transcript_49989/g.89745 Transcript_49989/m.89745 type:complete len:532 (-) Transcript_49989:104-1699(-)